MSPEPTHEPIEETFSATNVNDGVRVTNDTDSEDEDVDMAGYLPLSQIPTDSDPMLDDDEDEEWMMAAPGEGGFPGLAGSVVEQSMQHPTETIQVWTSTSYCNRTSNIDLDADKIDQVKTVMASFTLPTTAIPEWANAISEEQWKERLMDRIKEIQQRDGT